MIGRLPQEGGATPAITRGDDALLRVLLFLLAAAAALTPVRNFDYWWHLKTGAWILEHGAVPVADPFSFTAAGTPWVDHEWLYQVAAYLLHGVAGAAGMVLMKTAAWLLLVFMMSSRLRREGHGPAGQAVILLLAIAGASFRLDVRPELATLLFAPLLLHLCQSARDDGRPRRLLLVPPLVALWSNLHPGVILAPAMLGAGCLATLAADRLWHRPAAGGPRAAFPRYLALTTAAAALAVGVNPYGFSLYRLPFELADLLRSLPSPNLEWMAPEPGRFPLYFIALAAMIVIMAAGARRLDPIGAPALILSAILAWSHLRHLGLFFVLIPYGLGGPARAIVDFVQRTAPYRAGTLGGRVRPGFVAAAVVLAGGVPLLAMVPPRIAWGIGVAPGNEPSAAVDFLQRERVGERMFNDVKFGGYLIWRRLPEQRVFIDGRNEVYPDLLREVFAALGDADSWNKMLETHRIDAAFLRYPPALQKVVYPGREGRPPFVGERAFSTVYFPARDWALVYWDDDAMIFVRRGPRYDQLIGRREYSVVNPDDWRYLFAGVLMGRLPVEPILGEIQRKLEEDPDCRRARDLLATFSRFAAGTEATGRAGAGGARPGSPRAGG